jgi:hypothetical protein
MQDGSCPVFTFSWYCGSEIDVDRAEFIRVIDKNIYKIWQTGPGTRDCEGNKKGGLSDCGFRALVYVSGFIAKNGWCILEFKFVILEIGDRLGKPQCIGGEEGYRNPSAAIGELGFGDRATYLCA